jgi:hypothetical protein
MINRDMRFKDVIVSPQKSLLNSKNVNPTKLFSNDENFYRILNTQQNYFSSPPTIEKMVGPEMVPVLQNAGELYGLNPLSVIFSPPLPSVPVFFCSFGCVNENHCYHSRFWT